MDTSTPGKWIDKEHKIANASLGSTAFSVALNQVDDSDVLEMKQSKGRVPVLDKLSLEMADP